MADGDAGSTPVDGVRNRGGRKLSILIVILLMLGEGIGIFFLTKAINREPLPALAVEGGNGEGGDGTEMDLVEIDLGDCKPINRMTGKFVTFQLRVSVLVLVSEQERMKELVAENQFRIRDRINFVMRSAEPAHFHEAELETVKRRIKLELDRVFEDETLIQEVLIPEFIQSRPSL